MNLYGPDGDALRPERSERPESVSNAIERLAKIIGATDMVILAQVREEGVTRLVCSARGSPASMLGLAHEAPFLVRANLAQGRDEKEEG